MTSARMVVCASHTPGMLRDKAGEFGHAFRAGVTEAAARVAAFAPELVVFFGSDHRRAFVDPVPAIAVMTGAEGMGDLGSATGRYDVPAKIAAELAGRLLMRDFDITVGRNIALDHGFGQTYEQLIGSLPDVPVIPVYINCATPPLGRPGRAFALGRAVGEELAYLDQRVLFVGEPLLRPQLLRIRHDCGQGMVDVVGRSCHQVSQRSQLLSLHQFALQTLLALVSLARLLQQGHQSLVLDILPQKHERSQQQHRHQHGRNPEHAGGRSRLIEQYGPQSQSRQRQ